MQETLHETTFTVRDDEPSIMLRRTFHGPARKLWDAMTKPEYVERWYGPARYRVEVPELDLRVGGRWRFLNIEDDGRVWGFHGQYQELVPEKRIVQTWVFEGAPSEEVIQTATLEEHGGETTLTVRAVYPSFEARKADLEAGANEGAAETYDRLADVLASME